jgi:hypothetical protein
MEAHETIEAKAAKIPDIPPEAFVAANRIHVKDGSLFVGPNLVVHPRELHPDHEATLRRKLELTFEMDSPSFFRDEKNEKVIWRMAQIVPATSSEADYGPAAQTVSVGADHMANEERNRAAPMAMMLRERNQKLGDDPQWLEKEKNGLAIYILVNEALAQRGYREPAMHYISNTDSPEEVFAALSDKLGVSTREILDAAASSGVVGVGRLLGIAPDTIIEIAELVEDVAEHDFSINRLKHWKQARKEHAASGQPLAQQLTRGKALRIEKTITDLRAQVNGVYDVPEAIKQEEQRIAHALKHITPVERALMYRLGYEICFTPERTADGIAYGDGVYGLHRKFADDSRDARGTYRVYFAGKESEKSSLRTLRHEIAHNLWPNAFHPEEVQRTDQLVNADRTRLAALKALTTTHKAQLESFIEEYQAAETPEEKSRIQDMVGKYTAPLGIEVGMVLPMVQGADQLTWLVSEAHERLSIDGAFYDKTGYQEPSVRLREMIARYAELRDIEYHEQPQMQALLAFVAPGMTQIFNDIYIPHLQRVYEALETGHPRPGIAVAEAHARQASETPGTRGLSEIAAEERLQKARDLLAQIGV